MSLSVKEEFQGESHTEIYGVQEDKLNRAIPGVKNTFKGIEDDHLKKSEDIVYDGVNFSAMCREMNMQNMWHKRTWSEVLNHLAITLIVNALPTFFDVGTDINAVLEYWGSEDYAWSFTTFGLIFLPGIFFSIWIRKAFNIGCCKGTGSVLFCWFHALSPMGYILFPLILIAVKMVGLFNPGPEWKRFTVKITSFEGDFESSLQTLLALYIVLRRIENGEIPEWWQVAQLTASMVMITKTAISDYLLPRQPMSMKEELKATIILTPLFLSNGVFKVFSWATLAALSSNLLSWTFSLAVALLHLPNLFNRCCKIGYLTIGSPKHMIKLLVIQSGGRTTKQSMNNFLYNNICWFIYYTTLLSVPLALLTPQKSSDQKKEGTLQEIFYALCGVALSALVLNIVLIYFQLWRPFKAEQNRRTDDIESGADEIEEIEEEGSSSALFCGCSPTVGICIQLLSTLLLLAVFLLGSYFGYTPGFLLIYTL